MKTFSRFYDQGIPENFTGKVLNLSKERFFSPKQDFVDIVIGHAYAVNGVFITLPEYIKTEEEIEYYLNSYENIKNFG